MRNDTLRALIAFWRRTSPAAIAAVLLTAFAPTQSNAAFTPPVLLSTVSSAGSKVVVDADGNALVVWQESSRIKARTLSRAGVLGPTQTLSADGVNAGDADVAIDSDGDAIVVWTAGDHPNDYSRPGRIQGRIRFQSGVLSPIFALSSSGNYARHPRVAMDRDNDALVIWERLGGEQYRVQGRTVSVGRVLGPIAALSGVTVGARSEVTMNADGAAVISWEGPGSRVQARRRSADGTYGPIQTLARGRLSSAGIDAAGNAFVVWENGVDVQGRALSSAGALGAVAKLSEAYTGNIHSLQMAMASNGAILIAWAREFGDGGRVEGRFRTAGGAFGAIRKLSPSDTAGKYVNDVAIDARGNAVIAWERFRFRSDFTAVFIIAQARTFGVGGELGPIQTLHDGDEYSGDTRLAVSADGHAVATWGSKDKAFVRGPRVHAASGP